MQIELGFQGLGVAPAIEEVRYAYPWARSVVVAAISYLPPEHAVEDNKPRGLVARFARGADYHTVMREKLARLADMIRSEHPKAKTEVCVDTCPLPERKLALLAGIASRGKNGNVFVEGCGSWVALGEIVTNAILPASETAPVDLCGECEMCMRACPTRAIAEPYRVDAARCISQLTQMSGIVPSESRQAMGNRVYGCDVCQEVCPRNVGVEPINPEFAVECYPGASPDLLQMINLSKPDFNKLIRRSSVGWIRRTRIRRNAAIAAGNLKCGEAVPLLTEMLEDENPMLQAHAAWALKEIGLEG
ncbi:MAG: tRNA epoxyqueuosine(34) reductase QueG [Chloroflexi bacterium]|nr:tRNA epoxyqueuosine(34) reductase QueG [Chloroflexota bacterium]